MTTKMRPAAAQQPLSSSPTLFVVGEVDPLACRKLRPRRLRPAGRRHCGRGARARRWSPASPGAPRPLQVPEGDPLGYLEECDDVIVHFRHISTLSLRTAPLCGGQASRHSRVYDRHRTWPGPGTCYAGTPDPLAGAQPALCLARLRHLLRQSPRPAVAIGTAPFAGVFL